MRSTTTTTPTSASFVHSDLSETPSDEHIATEIQGCCFAAQSDRVGELPPQDSNWSQ